MLENANRYLRGNEKTVALNLLDRLIFMEKVLDQLQEEIGRNGVVENFINGKQNFIRESQALKSYNNTIKNYQKILAEVSKMIPDSNVFDPFSPIDD